MDLTTKNLVTQYILLFHINFCYFHKPTSDWRNKFFFNEVVLVQNSILPSEPGKCLHGNKNSYNFLVNFNLRILRAFHKRICNMSILRFHSQENTSLATV